MFEASKPFIDENEFLRKEMSKLQDNLTSNEEKHDQLMKVILHVHKPYSDVEQFVFPFKVL